ncbi:hypothetical protein JYT87_02670 [Nitrospira defluvii]|nr:hypothetical protein [Nitrospira defluvii]
MKQYTMSRYLGFTFLFASLFVGCSIGSRISTQQSFSYSVSENPVILGANNSRPSFNRFEVAMAMPVSQTVKITLEEWHVLPDKSSVPAGEVTFVVTNIGPLDTHEFVVFKTDMAPEALPAGSKGVDENGPGLILIGEIEGIPVGADHQSVSFDLEAGSYVLVCNIWDETEQESHYHEGMRTAFTVTEVGTEIAATS